MKKEDPTMICCSRCLFSPQPEAELCFFPFKPWLGLFAPQKLIPLLRAARDLSQPGRGSVVLLICWRNTTSIEPACGCRHGEIGYQVQMVISCYQSSKNSLKYLCEATQPQQQDVDMIMNGSSQIFSTVESVWDFVLLRRHFRKHDYGHGCA